MRVDSGNRNSLSEYRIIGKVSCIELFKNAAYLVDPDITTLDELGQSTQA